VDVPPDAADLALHAAINRVEGVDPGVYRSCGGCGFLHAVDRRMIGPELQRLYTQPSVNCMSANAVCYLTARFDRIGRLLGDRAYRIVNLLGGAAAQRICVAAAAHGLAARCSDAYDARQVGELLRLEEGTVPIFQIVIGSEQPGAGSSERYRLPILF
jgi:nitroreductase